MHTYTVRMYTVIQTIMHGPTKSMCDKQEANQQTNSSTLVLISLLYSHTYHHYQCKVLPSPSLLVGACPFGYSCWFGHCAESCLSRGTARLPRRPACRCRNSSPSRRPSTAYWRIYSPKTAHTERIPLGYP